MHIQANMQINGGFQYLSKLIGFEIQILNDKCSEIESIRKSTSCSLWNSDPIKQGIRDHFYILTDFRTHSNHGTCPIIL